MKRCSGSGRAAPIDLDDEAVVVKDGVPVRNRCPWCKQPVALTPKGRLVDHEKAKR